ncbi:MAG: hypothetical protein WA931_05015, partial [Rhodococcus sp. (in: high G+C Gram-positive bacteria)]
MTFEKAADELYGLDTADFVARRTELQKQARAEGEKDTAKRIAALRKPTTVGWVINVLVRDAADEVTDLLDLGEALREAQQHLSGATLRTLTKQRQLAVRALTERASVVASDRGKTVGEDVLREVSQTLNAALSESAVAEDVRRGRLTGALEYSGFGPMRLMAVDDLEPSAEETAEEPVERPDSAERERAEAEVADARVELADADAAVARAEDRLDEIREAIAELERQLAAAREAEAASEMDRTGAVSKRDAVRKRVA